MKRMSVPGAVALTPTSREYQESLLFDLAHS